MSTRRQSTPLRLTLLAILLCACSLACREKVKGEIVHLDMLSEPPESDEIKPSHAWNLSPLPDGWILEGFEVNGTSEAGGLALNAIAPEAVLGSPSGLALPLEAISEFRFRLASRSINHVRFAWSDDGESFLTYVRRRGDERFEDRIHRFRSALITVVPDGEMREYRISASELEPWGWRGDTSHSRTVDQVFLTVSNQDNESAELEVLSTEILLREDVLGVRPWGKIRQGVRAEVRQSLYDHHADEISFPLDLKGPSTLQFSAALLAGTKPGAELRILWDDQEVFRESFGTTDGWQDRRVSLSQKKGHLRLQTSEREPGTTVLWGHAIVAPEAPSRPNVILYMIDTLRADRLGIYGYERDTTPAMDSLAREGAVFKNCYAQSSWTRPSVASILTSSYPQSHGVTLFGRRVQKSRTTLAGRFRDAGYFTASYITNPNAGTSSGLDRGFDVLFETPSITGDDSDRKHESVASGTAKAISRKLFPWLNDWRVEPFFLYLHSNDPHMPYSPEPSFRRKFPPRTGAGKRPQAIQEALYDADIAANDSEISNLIEMLDRLGLAENTIVAITSDHGEEFGEHGGIGHGRTLHREVLQVPLIFWAPNRVKPGSVVEQTVETVDLFPTLLDLAGVYDAAVDMPLSGRSLLPYLSEGAEAGRSAFAHLISNEISKKRETAFAGPDFGEFSINKGGLRAILRNYGTVGPNDTQLFDLTEDPLEKLNLAESRTEDLDRLLQSLQEWKASQSLQSPTFEEPTQALGAAEEERLKALGYLQ